MLRVKEIKEYLLELEKIIFKSKRNYDYDDAEYIGIKNIRNLFDLSNDENYYKPIITNGAFNSKYIQYESMGCKKISVKEYIDVIRPYLIDRINNHKTQGKWRIHSGNTIIEHKTQVELKIQLTMEINFISSKKDSDETSTMHTKSNNIEIMMGSETDEIIDELFKSLLQRY